MDNLCENRLVWENRLANKILEYYHDTFYDTFKTHPTESSRTLLIETQPNVSSLMLTWSDCNVDEPTLINTTFTVYPTVSAYQLDTLDEWTEDENGIEFQNVCVSKEGKMKGMIIQLQALDETMVYMYRPLDVIHPDAIQCWQEDIIDKYCLCDGFVYKRTIYWKLEDVTCSIVYVSRPELDAFIN